MQKLEKEDIVAILKAEHDVVRNNFKKILASESPLRDIFSQTADAILNHFNGEEKLVFNKFENINESTKTIYALYEEHGIVRKQISELISITAASDNERWLAKAMVLDALLEPHFMLEENQIFPQAEKLLSDDEREELGRLYKNRQF
jgi:hemerythrin-like domain-containing protein